MFTAELYSSPRHQILQATITNPFPSFTVNNLQPETRYIIKIFSKNTRENSLSLELKTSTIKRNQQTSCPYENSKVEKLEKQARPVEPRLMQVKLDWSSRFQRSRFLENFRALAGLEENLDQTVP